MQTLKLKEDLYWCGVQDPELRTFDIIMETKFGTTYNAYVVKGSEGSCVIETAKERFAEEYLAKVADITPLSEVKYLIVNHTEPDHAGSAAALLQACPNITVVGTATAITFLKNIVNADFPSLAVKPGMTLSLGNKTLRFFPLPNLHWPDTMYTYVEELGALFTCDSFGSHYSHEGVLRSNVPNEQDYWAATRYYFDCILGPFRRPFMQNGIKTARQLQPAIICPGHGPVLDTGIDEVLSAYDAWCLEDLPFPNKTVVIAYVSAYGYTAQLAGKMAEGVRDAGADALLFNLEKAGQAQVAASIGRAQGLLLGSPTILQEALKPVWDLTSCLYPAVHKGKLASAFGSYAWSGEAVPHLLEKLRQLRMRVPDDGFKVRLCPTQEDLAAARAYGEAFAKQL